MAILNKLLSTATGTNPLDSLINKPLEQLIITGDLTLVSLLSLLLTVTLVAIFMTLTTKLAYFQMHDDGRNIDLDLSDGKPNSTFAFLALEIRALFKR